jgi:hypothetical protein
MRFTISGRAKAAVKISSQILSPDILTRWVLTHVKTILTRLVLSKLFQNYIKNGV